MPPDDLVKSLGANVDDATKEFLKKSNTLADAAGISTEVALDLATTVVVYQDVKSEDWLMAFVGALAGSNINRSLLNMKSDDVKVKYLQETFNKAGITLKPEEETAIIDAINIENNKIK